MNMNKNYLIKYLLSNESHNLIYHHKTTQIVSNQFIKLKRQKFWKRKLGQRDWQTDDKTVKKIIVPYVFIGSKDKWKKHTFFVFKWGKIYQKTNHLVFSKFIFDKVELIDIVYKLSMHRKNPKKLTNFLT